MGLFSIFDSRPGPGVRPDEPRKKGAARWWEVVSRDGLNYVRGGMLSLLAALPYLAGMYFSIVTHVILYLLLACVLGGLIAGPFFSALVDTILRSLRDDPSFLELGWRRALKQNWKDSLFPGVLFCTLYGVQIFTLYHLDAGTVGISDIMLLCLGLCATTAFFVWFWPNVALLKEPLADRFRNTVYFIFSQPLRTLGAAACLLAYLAAVLVFLPYSSVVFVFTNFWLPLSVSLLMIYKPMEETIHLEESIRAKQEKENGSERR